MIKIKKHDRRACCSAFLLFVFTGVLTLSVLVGALFGNPARMVRSLGGDTYVDGLYTEVHQYAVDLCLEYGLDTAVADAVTKDGVRTAVQTYAGVMLKSEDRSAKLAPALQEVRTALETAAAKAAPGATTAQVQDFGKAFADYMGGRMALVFAADLQSFVNLSMQASVAGGVIACCGVALAVWLLRRSGAAKRLQRLLAADGICAARIGDGAMRCDHAGAAAPKKPVYFSRVSLCGCYSVYDRLAVYVPGCRRTVAGGFRDCGLCTQGQEL